MEPTDILSYGMSLLPVNWKWIILPVWFACFLITIFVKPPQAGSRWILIYRIVSGAAMNFGWAKNAIQPGHDGNVTKPGDKPET